MSKSDHRKQTTHLSDECIEEMQAQAERLDLSLSRVAQLAWVAARHVIIKYPQGPGGRDDEDHGVIPHDLRMIEAGRRRATKLELCSDDMGLVRSISESMKLDQEMAVSLALRIASIVVGRIQAGGRVMLREYDGVTWELKLDEL